MCNDDTTMRDTAVKFDIPNDGPSSCPKEKDRAFIVTVNMTAGDYMARHDDDVIIIIILIIMLGKAQTVSHL